MKTLNVPSIDLDAIANPVAGEIRLRGKTYPVLQATPATAKLLQSVRTDEDGLTAMITAALRCVPDLEEEIFGTLSIDQVKAIVAISVGNMELVAQLDPNAASPAAANPSPG